MKMLLKAFWILCLGTVAAYPKEISELSRLVEHVNSVQSKWKVSVWLVG